MAENNRVQCRAHSTYRTRSNKWRVVRVPSGLSTHKIEKRTKMLVCQETGEKLNGIQQNRTEEARPSKRTVNRAYGGVLSMKACRDRILKAFLCEEHRKAVLASKQQAAKDAQKKHKKQAK